MKTALAADLQIIAKAARSSDRGIVALFAGAAGPAKTMAASILASALAMPLLRVELHAVVSKYIGETEKNLAKLFDAAEQAGAVLFFDEADGLFGTRTEVKNADSRFTDAGRK